MRKEALACLNKLNRCWCPYKDCVDPSLSSLPAFVFVRREFAGYPCKNGNIDCTKAANQHHQTLRGPYNIRLVVFLPSPYNMATEKKTTEVTTAEPTPSDSLHSEDNTVVDNADGKRPPPLLAKLIAVFVISCISFGSHWSSGVTGAMKSTLKKVRIDCFQNRSNY